MDCSKTILNKLDPIYHQYGSAPTYWVAYSGGLDSHVLLHALVALRSRYPNLNLHALHINHSLSPNAASWARHCAKVCAALAVTFTERTIHLATAGESLEDVARQARYAVFAEFIQSQDLLLTAHHEDDQAETVLLQLFRGAGPKGLAAMPAAKLFGMGWHLRPLLTQSRAQLVMYARQQQLHWIDDESNKNVNFSRNFIRHTVLSTVKERWPSVANTLARVAANCAEAQRLLNEVAQQDFMLVKGRVPETLSVKKLLQLTPDRQRQVLRFWLQQLHFPLPNTKKLLQIQKDLLHAAVDKLPHCAWQNVELRRYRDELYALLRLVPHDATQIYSWNFSHDLLLPGVGTLRAEKNLGEGVRADLMDITIRFRQGGEVCHLPGRNCHHDLKKLFQAWHVPTWQRNRIPLVYHKEKLIAVVGFFVDSEVAARVGDEGYSFSWLPE